MKKAEFPKVVRVGQTRATIYKSLSHGSVSFTVIWYEGAFRKRKAFGDLVDAKVHASPKVNSLSKGEAEILHLSGEERISCPEPAVGSRFVVRRAPRQCASRVSQLADVADVPLADGTQIRRSDGGHRHRPARERDKLNLVSRAVLVDHRSDITRLEVFFGQIGRQHNTVMFFDFHQSSKR